MTYGVDQCRCCGKPIKVARPEQMKEYQDSLRRTPTMPEAEWRAAGFLAMPTIMQMRHPASGCCSECGIKLVRKQMGGFRRMAKVAVGGVIAFSIIWVVALYITH